MSEQKQSYEFNCINPCCGSVFTFTKEEADVKCQKRPAMEDGFHEYSYRCGCGWDTLTVIIPDEPECIISVPEIDRGKILKPKGVSENERGGLEKEPTTLTKKEQSRLDRAKKIAETLNAKNKAYRDSFAKSGEILSILFPDISKERATVILAIARIIDKLSRITNDPTAFGEDPAMDIAGYAMLLQELVSNE